MSPKERSAKNSSKDPFGRLVDTLLGGHGHHPVWGQHHQRAFGRGFDYYTGVVFELHDAARRADGQLVAGGRYDALLARLGNVSLPAVGFAVWIERLASLGGGA